MAKKTFKIGECAKGGIIFVEISGKKVTVIGKEWDNSKGYNKSSDQSNAKEFTRYTVQANHSNSERELDTFLNDLTTSYYSEQILDWIKSKVSFSVEPWFANPSF